MARIDGVVYILNMIESAALGVEEERCICVRNRNADCLRCAKVCASGAISVQGDCLRVEPELCIGCGTCATACPTGALQAKNPTDNALSEEAAIKLLANDNNLIVSCKRAMQHANRKIEQLKQEQRGLFKRRSGSIPSLDEECIVEVTCLGRIDESFLVEMAARGAKRITFVDHDCKSCKYHRGGELAQAVTASATALTEAFGNTMCVERITDLPPEAYTEEPSQSDALFNESRRSFFTGMRNGMSGAVATVADGKVVLLNEERPSPRYTKVKDGTLHQEVPSRRIRLINSMRRLGEPKTRRVDTRLWGRVEIDRDACSSCRMCTVFCPTGALSKTEAVKTGCGIAHRPALCMQCRLCESLCPSHALKVSSKVEFEQFRPGAVERIELNAPKWQPNRPESMFERSAELIGDGNLRCF